jgi:polyisoprenyl-teichoic acid--peptidoglycan teichoic acid transferase
MKNDFFDSPPQTRGPRITVITPQERSAITLPPKPSTGKRIFKSFLALLLVGIIGFGGLVAVRATNLSNKIFVGEKTSFYSKLTQFVKGVTGRDVQMIGESNGQINILLLGIGGAGHDGGYLSDTIMLAQIRPDDKKASIISIPRDYLADLGPTLGQRKINAAFAEGYNKNKSFNDGGKAALKAVEDISGLTIPYFAVVDFKGFQEGIDVIGGIDVTIDKTFTDSSYPDSNEGYLAPVTFKAGPEHMNGSRALIFARSRHGNNNEGSDFARSIRQRKVIEATKDKAVSLNLITDSGKLNELLTVLGNHFHTNIQLDEMLHLYSMTKDFSKDSIVATNLDPNTGLICPQILESNGAYVLAPCPGKKSSDIKNFFQHSFELAAVQNERTVVWLADSTKKIANYNGAQRELEGLGMTVYQIGYTGSTLSSTAYYQVNKKPSSASLIKSELGAQEVSLPPEGVKTDPAKVDVVVIIGSNYVPPKVPQVQSATTTTAPSTETTKPATTTTPTPKTPAPVVDPKTIELDKE